LRPDTLPRHVTIVVNDLQPYGSQRVALTLVGAIAHMGIHADLITLEPTDRDDLPVPAGVGRLSIVRRAHGAVGFAGLIVRLARVLHQRRPDLVISHMVMANVTTLAATGWMINRRCPVLVTDHNTTANLSIERSPRALDTLVRVLYPRARRVIGVSDAVVQDLIDRYRLKPSHVRRVFNPVDVEMVRRAGGQPAPHPWLEADSQTQTVVCVGALRRAKGQDILIAALARVPDVRVIFVGGGDLQTELEATARGLGVSERIEFVGYRSDALVFIAHAKALVVPSRWEGFGLVAVEAAALGIPVLGTAVSGLSELIPGMVPGLLVAPEDPSALAAGLIRVLDDRVVNGGADLRLFEPREVALRYLAAARPDDPS
jgi:glycosyltransferase involved in cell wall biosynthesis